MSTLSSDDLIDAFKEMTLLELSGFVKQFEEIFEVSAAPIMVPASAVSAEEQEEITEKTEFDVVLSDIGPKKINVIKALREVIKGTGLKEAKELVESAPVTLQAAIALANAEEIKKKLDEAGATVVIR